MRSAPPAARGRAVRSTGWPVGAAGNNSPALGQLGAARVYPLFRDAPISSRPALDHWTAPARRPDPSAQTSEASAPLRRGFSFIGWVGLRRATPMASWNRTPSAIVLDGAWLAPSRSSD